MTLSHHSCSLVVNCGCQPLYHVTWLSFVIIDSHPICAHWHSAGPCSCSWSSSMIASLLFILDSPHSCWFSYPFWYLDKYKYLCIYSPLSIIPTLLVTTNIWKEKTTSLTKRSMTYLEWCIEESESEAVWLMLFSHVTIWHKVNTELIKSPPFEHSELIKQHCASTMKFIISSGFIYWYLELLIRH